MKIDCFCFSAPWLATTNYNISENDDDNTIQIKTKEQELIDFVKDKDVMIVFDRNTKKFYMVVKQIVIKKLEFFYLFFQTIILNKKGIDHNFFVKEKMNHVYPIYPMKEGHEALSKTAKIIDNLQFFKRLIFVIIK